MANVAVAAKQQALGNLKRAAPDATEAFPKHPEKLRGRKRPRISNRQHEKVAEPEVAVNAHQTSVDTKRLQAEEEDELRCLSSRARANVEGIMPRIKAQVAERTSTESSRIDLSTAENCLLRDALTATYKHGISSALASKHLSYPQGFTGNPDLLKAIALFVNEHFDPRIPVEPEHVITAPGAASCIDSMLFNLCEPGDGVLVPGPYWNGFDFKFRVRAGVEPIVVNTARFDQTFTCGLIPTLAETIRTSKIPIKALLLTNPHNPFGQCYPKHVLEGCARFCQDHDIHLISDEVYALSTFDSPDFEDPVPFMSALSLDLPTLGIDPSRVHVIWSISKDFGSSGLRMGCAITQHNPSLKVGLALAANTQTSSLSAIATTHLLSSPNLRWILELNSLRLSEAYRTVTSFFKWHSIQYVPANAGLFVFAKLAPGAKIWEDEAEVMEQCRQEGVLVSAGKNYHGIEDEKGWVRITFAVEKEVLKEGLERVAKALGLGSAAS